MGKFFRYEGAANSQNLANFGNRTTCEIRCRFDQRIRKFFVRRITSEFVLSSLCEIFPNFVKRLLLFARYSLCEFAANSQKDSSRILCARQTTAEGGPNSISIRNANSQPELPNSYRRRSEMKTVLKYSVHRWCAVAEKSQIGSVRLRSRFVCEMN